MKSTKPSSAAHCPACGAELDEKTILDASRRILSRIGGQAKGACKVRDHKTLSDAATRRWERWRKEHGRPPKT